ncbi:hypothetical protein NPIL_650321 [Nephila pilipes]|uniref:Uncharacterized protein n=1 Tax=Nephila pilipes TaxID=299642 RepID=A0A8X6QS23_NEPPI|nr:hypothetical protein NPIL_650321 [Nephila pilipes]
MGEYGGEPRNGKACPSEKARRLSREKDGMEKRATIQRGEMRIDITRNAEEEEEDLNSFDSNEFSLFVTMERRWRCSGN